MALFITQCPHCMTCFRTSITQLQSAEGMVRCGACLKIFVADDNLLPSPDLRTVDVPVPVEEVKHLLEKDEQQLPLDDEDFEREFADNIFTLDLADSLPNRHDPSISEHQPIWELLDEDTPSAQEYSETHTEHEEELMQESDTYQESPPQVFEEEEQLPSFGATEFHEHSLDDDLGVRTRFTPENLAAARDISDPLELHWQPPERRGRYIFLMSVLALVLTAGLLAQFVWYNMNDLSQNASVRASLERVCNLLGCELPPMVAIRSISSDNLVVRSHTEIANALSVNLVFRNNATFAQPFPLLNLRFTDVNDVVVAERRFTPEEYLPADIASMNMMPAGAPVQVTLEVMDPGSTAINYEVSFSPMSPLTGF
ncbi:MAG: zinc-ribbon and DUF3426 domain-containing protein [Gammaproteobacteria bacterium]|nr:zinc-ribbon and DUF3426 domain-containing protein [Gammaproteobacteria bacterium]MDP2142417.1 zinc-ribbon and DUF3426 domain-containing protein [Gammaproteobacteria bacterium]MDP2348658.1 zinc-ribbon and DUF3426 domain-containing protein [Gammaproteobacteria bacterium]